MLDLNLLRDNPEQIREALARKKFDCDLDGFYRLDEERRAYIARFEAARSEQKKANNDMAALQKGSPEFIEKVQSMKALSAEVKELEGRTREVEEQWKELYLDIPNLPDSSVPSGVGHVDNLIK